MRVLQGKKILITRDASQAGSLREKLEALGVEVFCVPTIAISDPPNWAPFDTAASERSQFDWIVFSSVNAVIRTADRLSYLRLSHKSIESIDKAAVGNQTSKVAENIGWPIKLVPDRFQAEDLLESMLKSGVDNKRIWIPRALEARPYLVDELNKAGAQVTETPVYQNTVPYENRDRLREVLANEEIDWITYTSSSTVTNFIKILDQPNSLDRLPKIASIGRVTTETLTKNGLSPVFTADPQNLEGLCQGILNAESPASNPR